MKKTKRNKQAIVAAAARRHNNRRRRRRIGAPRHLLNPQKAPPAPENAPEEE